MTAELTQIQEEVLVVIGWHRGPQDQAGWVNTNEQVAIEGAGRIAGQLQELGLVQMNGEYAALRLAGLELLPKTRKRVNDRYNRVAPGPPPKKYGFHSGPHRSYPSQTKGND